jgi:hypothetical protein
VRLAKPVRLATLFVSAALAGMVLGTACSGSGSLSGGPSAARGQGSAGTQQECETLPSTGTQIAAAKLFIEHNSTDEDTGVHGAFDDHGWSLLCVFDPSGRQVLAVEPHSGLKDLTMAGIFFESREPPNDEYSIADLKEAFPEGKYSVRARSFDGSTLVGQASFTHDIPAAVVVTAPRYVENEEDAGKVTVSRNALEVRWDPVAKDLDGNPVDVTGYEVIVTPLVPDDPNGFSRPGFDVHVGPGVSSVRVPPEVLDPKTAYELEVLVIERSGNQTITAGFFSTD